MLSDSTFCLSQYTLFLFADLLIFVGQKSTWPIYMENVLMVILLLAKKILIKTNRTFSLINRLLYSLISEHVSDDVI